ncbi:MAG: hypothetical protein AAGB00_04445 [Planctomycetota bacterium]
MAWRLLLLLLVAVPHAARAQQGAEPSKPAPPIVSDEPRTVDPAGLMPEALAVESTVRFDGESLLEVADWLKAQGVTVLFNRARLEEIGLPLGEPFFNRLDKEPLYLLLGRLKTLGLAWCYEDGVVTITSAEDAEQRLETRTYNLSDLLDADYDRDVITDVILSTISSETWAENGGGEAEARWLGDVLFLSQTADAHRRVAGLVIALRDHGRQTFIFDPPQHTAIRRRLAEPVSIALRQTPLVVAIDELSKASGVYLRLDRGSAARVGVSPREPVTLALKGRSLRTVLRATLRDLELTVMMRDGMLWVASEEEAELLLKTAVYDVRDLCMNSDESESLADAILSQLAAETWAENGGGEAEVRFAKPGAMVVSQTEEVHRDLLALLQQYRDALEKSKPRTEPGPDPDEVLTRYYRLPTAMATSLRELLPTLAAGDWFHPKTNRDGIGTVLIAGSEDEFTSVGRGETVRTPQAVLVVKQARATHLTIESIIDRLRRGDGSLSSPASGGGGMGGGGGGFGSGYFSVE